MKMNNWSWCGLRGLIKWVNMVVLACFTSGSEVVSRMRVRGSVEDSWIPPKIF